MQDIAIVPDSETVIYSAYVPIKNDTSKVRHREDMDIIGVWFHFELASVSTSRSHTNVLGTN